MERQMIHDTGFLDVNTVSTFTSPIALVVLNRHLPRLTPYLWSKAKLRICADGGANHLFNYMPPSQKRFIPEYIIGDLDSIEPAIKEFYASQGTEIIDKSDDQDTTDLNKCVAFIRNHSAEENTMVVVVGALGGRFDHEMGNLNVLYAFPDQRVILLSDENVVLLLPKGYQHKIQVNGFVGTHCGLIPLGAASNCTKTTGLKWNLDSMSMAFGSLVSTSNIIMEKIVSVESDADLLWTMEIKPPS